MTDKKICNDELLTLYYYQEIGVSESHALEQHLLSCAPCRAALDELGASLAAVPQRSLTLSTGQQQQFSAGVLQRARQPRGLRLSHWGTGLAVASALGLLVVLLRPIEQPASLVPGVPAGAALAELEVLEQFELLQEFDLLQNLELLQELG